VTTTQLRLFADYFQLHVMDEDAEDDLSDAWTPQAVSDALAVERARIGGCQGRLFGLSSQR
jgi:hypothetical protein